MKIKILLILISLTALFNSYAQYAPDGAVHTSSEILLRQTPIDKPWAAARCDVATLHKGVPNNGKLEVDFMEIIRENTTTGTKTVITREDYNNTGVGLTTHEGGLYLRNPWFVTDDTSRLMSNAIQTDSSLVIRVGEQPDFISHFWSDWVNNAPNTRLYVRIRFKITGDIGFQFGLDYAPTSDGSKNDHSEAFYSHWYNDTNGEFITETSPNYDESVKFDREHYGFYTNGVFFISKEMVDAKNGSIVELKTGATFWKPELMTLKGDRYEFDTRERINNTTEYCFRLNQNENSHIPAFFMLLVDNPLVHPEDAIYKGNNGYNFYTNPLIPLSSKELNKSGNIKISYSPDSVYLNIFSPHKIKRLFVTDMEGRTSYDYRANVPDKIVIAGFNTGAYIVTIETDKGVFSEKFIK